MNEMRKLMEAIDAISEPVEKHQRELTGLKDLIDDFEWRLEGQAYQLKIQGHEASAASIMNIEADIQSIKRSFNAAINDLGKKYNRPGDNKD